ncbi:hypothetical protein BC332_14026 [Capsicum chinense]|nr:hypothetical protein BC332_14026 [Capsicum chinense]
MIRSFSIPTGLPWHLIEQVYIPINYGDEFHWVLDVVVLKERCIRVYDSMLQRRRSEPSFEIQKLAKILPTYLDISFRLPYKISTAQSSCILATELSLRKDLGNEISMLVVSWSKGRGEDDAPITWQIFQDAFLDRFFSLELREAKTEEFMNLR